jgi:DNA-binding CsgD family transcriptional regulator
MLKTMASGPSGETERAAVRTVACLDVRLSARPSDGRRDDTTPSLPESALHRIQGAVRADDRVCPIGTSKVAVEFGPVANGVPPQVLGYRLAQAIGRDLPPDASPADLAVSVGMAAPSDDRDASNLTRRALAASEAGRSQLGRRPFAGTQVFNTVMTVDRLVPMPPSGPPSALPSMHRRNVSRYHVGRKPGAFVPLSHAAESLVPASGDTATTDLTVLVIDLPAERSDGPGFAAITAVSVAERLGCRSAAVAATHDDKPAMAIDGFPLDLVVLVLEGGWAGGSSTWASGAWGVSARLTSTYRGAEVPVLAVSAGAGAGAVASCVAQGAQALFSLDQLPDTLRSLSRFAGDDFTPASETPLPSQFRALVGLTASERRILFYLTEGWAAQDIADELVVSLTTVRSHIRSTLRKLGVRSQLAAVAIANSRDLEHAQSRDAS